MGTVSVAKLAGDFPGCRVVHNPYRNYSREKCVLSTAKQVIWCLLTYTDWWQPSSASILLVGAARRGGERTDGIHPGLVETLDERTELCRRVARISERERQVLFLWYMRQLPVREIATALGVSIRQCQRTRAKAIARIVELGSEERAA